MLYQIGIKDGFAQIKGSGRHIKIISAATPLRIQAQDSDGRVLLDSKIRSPMATELPAPAAVINIYAENQTVELWYSNQPLEYFQLTAVGATSARASEVKAPPGITKLVDANPRVKFRVVADADVKIGNLSDAREGWPIAAGEKEEFESSARLYVSVRKPVFDPASVGVPTETMTGSGHLQSIGAAFFAGRFFVTNETSTREFVIAGAAVNDITSKMAAAAIAMRAYKGALYCVVHAAGIVYLYRSFDGVNFAVVNSVAGTRPGFMQTAFYDGVLTMSSGSSTFQDWYQFNLQTNEIIKRQNIIGGAANLRYIDYMGETFIVSSPQGLYKVSGNDLELVYLTPTPDTLISRMTLSEQNGDLIALVGDKPAKFNPVTRVFEVISTLSQTVQVNGLSERYVYIGCDAWASNSEILFIPDDQYTAKSMPGWVVGPCAVDYENNLLYRVQEAGGGAYNLKAITLPDIVEPAPVNIKVLEFFP